MQHYTTELENHGGEHLAPAVLPESADYFILTEGFNMLDNILSDMRIIAAKRTPKWKYLAKSAYRNLSSGPMSEDCNIAELHNLLLEIAEPAIKKAEILPER